MIKSGAVIALSGTSIAGAIPQSQATTLEVATSRPSASAQKQAIIEGIRKEEIYLPTPSEILALSGSQAEATTADNALRSLSASDLKINLQIKSEQDKLTAQYRSQNLSSLDKSRPGLRTSTSSTPASGSIRVQIMDAWGNYSDYSHTGNRDILPVQAQAWRPNFSNSRVYASYDPTNGSKWWSIWRSQDYRFHYFPKVPSPRTSGVYYWCTVSRVERYKTYM